MFKKFFAVFFLAATLLVVGQSSDAEAARIPVGHYEDNGEAAYLLTETISRIYAGGGGYRCIITSRSGSLEYRFFYEDGGWKYWNSWPASGWVYDGTAPVARNALNYIRNNY